MSPDRRHVTITLDVDTERWVRVEAARHDTSVSRFVAEVLRERMEGRTVYEAAAGRFIEQTPHLEPVPGRTLPSRDELHDRPGLR